MERKQHIAIVIGSLRKESFSRRLANVLVTMQPGSAIVEIGDLPLYNEDLEKNPPESYGVFRAAIKASDGVLFVTPEYNRSIPAPMKNAIDVGSRPMKESAWNGKPAAIISVSRGAMGGFGASHHLRQSLVGVNAFALAHPEIHIGGVAALFGEDGKLSNPATQALLEDFMKKFQGWVDRFAAG